MDPNVFGSDIDSALLVLLYGGGCLLALAVQAFVCWLLMRCYAAISPRHRRMEPGMTWLLLIPLFQLVWNFFVFLRLSDSLCDAFGERGESGSVGDCGRTLGLWYSICVACSWIPCVGTLTALAALVLLILYLVKVWDLKSRLELQPATEDWSG